MSPEPENRAKAVTVKSQAGVGPVVSSICISMVKNEQDIIEPFLRHNHKFFDAMIILDHGSTDDTRRIAVDCSRELGGIFVSDLNGFSYAQAEMMTAAMHFSQSAFFADFVCFLDADEFIGAPDRKSFEKALAKTPVGAAVQLPWQTFLPDPDLMTADCIDPIAYMTLRRSQEKPQYLKSFFRFGGGADSAIVTGQGNHAFQSQRADKITHVISKKIPLRHLPLRSAQQLLTKAVVGWLANVARFPDPAQRRGLGLQWKRIFDLAGRDDQPISNELLFAEAMAYAQNDSRDQPSKNAQRAENGITTERRYSTGAAADHYKTVALSLIKGHQDRPNPFDRLLSARVNPNEPNAPNITNAFDDAWHWQNLFLDVAPFRYIAEKYQPKSALDIGCGNGLYLKLIEQFGVSEIKGIDGIETSATVLDEKTYGKVDLQLPYREGKTFDAVFCLEVVEHINPNDTDVLFDTIAAHAKDLIVFSMAEPGQPGNGHINCLTIEQVLAHWGKRGFDPDLVETLGLRALSTMSWFRRNLLVLKRRNPDQHDQTRVDKATAALRKIGALKYKWYRQEAGIRAAPFEEPFPKKGYGTVRP
jgi:SAM-dependent methyltransferase